MEYRDQLLTLARVYATATNRSEARVGTLVANSGSFFLRLREGKTLTVDLYLRVQGWFASNWPADLPWPDGCDRPGKLPVYEATTSPEAA